MNQQGTTRATEHVTERVTVRVPIAPLMAAARPSSGQTSQLIRGHQGDVLEEDGAWRRIVGADGYDGWCHRGYLTSESLAVPSPLRAAWSCERRMSLGCTVRKADSVEIALPLGAILEPDEEVTHGLAMNHRARARYFATDGEAIARRAVELFRGVPYQWGGVTPWGCDCSGFVQTMYALHGTQLPRDGWMQGERGREIGGEPAELQAADLLFFSDRDDGRITHVALSLGGPELAHLSLANGGFGINSLNSSDPVADGLRGTFRFARRVL
ncbi:MAG: C40 family peptidase [Gemmatimonadaceae bacterium]